MTTMVWTRHNRPFGDDFKLSGARFRHRRRRRSIREHTCALGRRGRETSKNPSGHGQVGDRREDSHSFATFRTGKRIDLEDTLK
jgi:hypothetical protein